MKRYLVAAFGLAVLVAALLLLTRFDSADALRGDVVTASLGFAGSQSARARAIDEALLDALEGGHFNAELRQRLDQSPHLVQLEPFWADTCEVRQIDFERYARWQHQGATQTPQNITIAGRGDAASLPNFPSSDAESLRSSSTGHRIAGLLQSPASGVNYAGAAAYCQSAGGRLPWAEEWEAMAVGREQRLYPWGDTFVADSWPYLDAYRNASQPCGVHAKATTPEGVHDLAGNVMEWSRGRRTAHGLELRPGAHGAPAIRSNARTLYALSAAYLEIRPQTRSHHLGFRCVYEHPPVARLPWGAMPKAAATAGGIYRLGVPPDLHLARVAILLPETQRRSARSLIRDPQKARRIDVMRCEVTRREYAEFLHHPLVRLGLFANENAPRGQDYTPQNWQQQLEEMELPVSGVDWWAADAFARWAGGRLPHASEWQLVAAGPQARVYPWGDDYEIGVAATGDRPQPGLRPCAAVNHDSDVGEQDVGADQVRDVSADGVHDLAGNVSEWTLSLGAERGGYAAWVHGGNYLLPGKTTARSVFGRFVPLSHRSATIGLRVVYD